jgi:hypothetical protein
MSLVRAPPPPNAIWRGRRVSTVSRRVPLAGGRPISEHMPCASPCGKSTTSPATSRTGVPSSMSTQHSPSVMRWKITTRSAPGSSTEAAVSAWGDR